MRISTEIESAVENLRGARRGDGVRSCELAQIIWNSAHQDTVRKDISQQLIHYMQTEPEVVRSTIAWAIADFRGPRMALDWLKDNGLEDECDSVRSHTLVAIKESGAASPRQLSQVRTIANEDFGSLKELAESILEL